MNSLTMASSVRNLFFLVLFSFTLNALGNNENYPTTYDGFTLAAKDNLQALISSGVSKILLPQGTYFVNNPITIDQSMPLIIHGAGRMKTEIIAANPDKPLFRIARLPYLSLAAIEFKRADGANLSGELGALIEFNNSTYMEAEIQDSFFRSGGIYINGPASVTIQGSHWDGLYYPSGYARTAVRLNNSQALAFIVGGNMSKSNFAHIEQVNGHLEVYGTGMQERKAAVNGADIVLNRPSPISQRAHMVVNVRTEGISPTELNGYTSPDRLIYVPATSAGLPVSVVAKANEISTLDRTNGCLNKNYSANVIADYNASGTLWLIGNNAATNAKNIVVATGAGRIRSIGNSIEFKGCATPTTLSEYYAIAPGSTVDLKYQNDIFHNELLGASANGFSGGGKITDISDLPRSYFDGKIPKLTRPKFTGQPSPLFLTTVTCASKPASNCLQSAITKSGAAVFIPAGTYYISEPIVLNQSPTAVGGLVAGAGSENTKIICEGPLCTSVFTTNGLGYVTLQGIGFEIQSGPTVSTVVDLRFATPYFATQGNNFYDIKTTGGKYGVGVGLKSPSQCSENIFIDTSIQSAHQGFSLGGANALANIFHGVTISGVQEGFGHADAADTLVGQSAGVGGAWSVYSANVNASDSLFNKWYGSARTYYHNNLIATAPKIISQAWSTTPYSVVFDNSEITNSDSSQQTIVYEAAQGFNFINSKLIGGNFSYAYQGLGGGNAKAINGLNSDLPGLSSGISPNGFCRVSVTGSFVAVKTGPAAPVIKAVIQESN